MAKQKKKDEEMYALVATRAEVHEALDELIRWDTFDSFYMHVMSGFVVIRPMRDGSGDVADHIRKA